MPTSRSRSPFARRRWTLDDAREVLATLDRSGKAVRVFAAAHGIDPQRIYAWRRRLGKAEPTTFQEIVVHPSMGRIGSDEDGALFEIALVSGDVVRVPASFDEGALARLLGVLARTRAC